MAASCFSVSAMVLESMRKQIVEIELRAVGFALYLGEAQAFIEQQLDRLDQCLQALRVILLVERLDIVVRRWRPDADHVCRQMEARADRLSGPLELLDHLRL
jgi:hypothetical protein